MMMNFIIYDLCASSFCFLNLIIVDFAATAAGVVKLHAPPQIFLLHFLHSHIPTHVLFVAV